MEYFLWDVNGDVPYGGDWEYGNYGNYVYPSVNDLIAAGVPTDEWTMFYVAGVDDEGKISFAADWMYLSSGGGVPEPASLCLLATGALFVLRRRKQ